MFKKLKTENNTRVFSIEAKASKVNDATTGRIVITSKDFHKVIPAVVFTPEKAEKLLEKMEEANTTANELCMP